MTTTGTLNLSKDRKVTVYGTLQNAFGLPAGISCPGMTELCGKVCYAKKIERMPYLKSVRNNLAENWNLLKDADFPTMVRLLSEAIDNFRGQVEKRNVLQAKRGKPGVDLKFRIHWDGDFFSRRYAMAWALVIKRNPDIQFWAYTRSFVPEANYIPWLANIDNLSLYLSVDEFNKQHVAGILEDFPGVKIALLADTMAEAAEQMKEFDSKPGAKCPELIGKIPLINEDTKQGACIACNLCPMAKANIRFAIKGH